MHLKRLEVLNQIPQGQRFGLVISCVLSGDNICPLEWLASEE